jgi:hypothetical protein
VTDDTLLHRQIHPLWVQQGRVTSQAFRPTPKDQKCLSVYDGDQISAENAWMHYTAKLGLMSTGVLAVSVAECIAQGLSVSPDPAPFPEHTLIDFSAFSEKPIRTIAKHLKARAELRGWQYQVDNSL